MGLRTIEWSSNRIKLIDQTQLPGKFRYIYIDNLKSLWEAIRLLRVRGAPALGAAAGLGVYLGIKDFKGNDLRSFAAQFKRVIRYIGSSRPTARNLFWGLERMAGVLNDNRGKGIPRIKKLLFKEANDIIEEDRRSCRKIGLFGSRLIKNNDSILTICNTGTLATIDYGTALGVVYRSREEGKRVKVYALETRPLLQGSRLTAWELKRSGIDVTLICDSMAAVVMRDKLVTKVIAGADRIASNGDAANKIGTYALAVLSRYHGLPFYIAAPFSTFDLNIKSGRGIIIEERGREEVTALFFKKPVAPSLEEIKLNPRSRSAKLRAIIKL